MAEKKRCCLMCGKLIRKRNKKYCCRSCGVKYRKLKKAGCCGWLVAKSVVILKFAFWPTQMDHQPVASL